MAGGLTACSMSAKAIAAAINKPVVGVHHMVSFVMPPLGAIIPANYRTNDRCHCDSKLTHSLHF